jgi:hypothetical protein
MRFRALALVLSLVCLLAGPRAFADKHKDDSDKDAPKKATTQKKPEKAAPAQQSQPQGNNQHGSSGQSHSGSSGSTNTGTHEHSGGTTTSTQGTQGTQGTTEHAHHAAPTTVHDAGNATHTPSYHPPAKTDNRTPGYHATHGEEHHAVVNHEHLHERMQAHPTVEARHQAYERYRTERAQFTRHAPVIHFVPAHRVVLTKIRIVPTTYHYRRTVFYDEYGWQAPVYVYSYYPRYGLWDATFLMFALDHVAEEQYAMMFYHHQREEDMQRWMADSERLAADNQELRDKLDAMKVQMAKLEGNGLEADPSYVPPDAQDVALSPEVIDKLTSSN